MNLVLLYTTMFTPKVSVKLLILMFVLPVHSAIHVDLAFKESAITYNVLEQPHNNDMYTYVCTSNKSVTITELTTGDVIVYNSVLLSKYKDQFNFTRENQIYKLDPYNIWRNQSRYTYVCNDKELTINVVHTVPKDRKKPTCYIDYSKEEPDLVSTLYCYAKIVDTKPQLKIDILYDYYVIPTDVSYTNGTHIYKKLTGDFSDINRFACSTTQDLTYEGHDNSRMLLICWYNKATTLPKPRPKSVPKITNVPRQPLAQSNDSKLIFLVIFIVVLIAVMIFNMLNSQRHFR